MRAVPTTLLVALAAAAATAVRPNVVLREDVVALPVPPDDLITRLRERFSHDELVIAGDQHRLVCQFAGRAGMFSYHTVEIVSFEPQAVTFKHLRGPFATCSERFDVTHRDDGCVVTHRGTFRLRGGLWTWPLAVGPVRAAFERHVRTHLERLRAELGG